jgi:hypothetical protein
MDDVALIAILIAAFLLAIALVQGLDHLIRDPRRRYPSRR